MTTLVMATFGGLPWTSTGGGVLLAWPQDLPVTPVTAMCTVQQPAGRACALPSSSGNEAGDTLATIRSY